ncbi:hypothetical protein HK098_003186 [Nowakowskiella sp. JEL0407]|nr:hypothetical protein HK098_003186 [Nowakowskiella sp. JEL0407]
MGNLNSKLKLKRSHISKKKNAGDPSDKEVSVGKDLNPTTAEVFKGESDPKTETETTAPAPPYESSPSKSTPPNGDASTASISDVETVSTKMTVAINSETAEKWQPEYYHLMRPDARLDQKRRYHAVENSVYPLPADIEEQDRLELQHILYRYGFNAQFHMPIHVQMMRQGLHLLDVGCGPGSWTRDVAFCYPEAQVWGVDMAQSLFAGVEVLPNMKFFTGNVLESLPFEDNTFDGIYQRLMILAIPNDKWDQVIKELLRILKPGGYLELCEPDLECINMGPNFEKLMTGMNNAMSLRKVDYRIAQTLAGRMMKQGMKLISDHACSFPCGWDGKHGDLQLINVRQGFIGMKPYLTKAFSMSSEEFDEILELAIAECPEYKTCFNAYAFVGQKV